MKVITFGEIKATWTKTEGECVVTTLEMSRGGKVKLVFKDSSYPVWDVWLDSMVEVSNALKRGKLAFDAVTISEE